MAENFGVYDALSRRMNWLGERQSVISKNVANADTPDYQPQKLKEPGFVGALERELKPMSPQVTDARHINANVPDQQPPQADEQDETYETKPNDNAVSLQEQMVKMSKTKSDHRAMTNLYRKHMSMFSMAWGAGR